MELYITPNLKLLVVNPETEDEEAIAKEFKLSNSDGLLALFASTQDLPEAAEYFRSICEDFFRILCLEHDIDVDLEELNFEFESSWFEKVLNQAPPMAGGEYISVEFLHLLVEELRAKVFGNAKISGLRDYLEREFPNWLQIGHVYFHLAENKSHKLRPFAFLATFSTKASGGRLKHLPLGQAVNQFSSNKKVLLNFLKPLQKTSKESNFVKDLVDSGNVYKPVPLGPSEAHKFLSEMTTYERNGIVVRVPQWWQKNARPRVKVKVTVKSQLENRMDANSLLDFSVELSVGEKAISSKDWKKILEANDKLILLNGKWIEVDPQAISSTLDHWQAISDHAASEGVSFTEAMRLLSRASITKDDKSYQSDDDWSDFVAGKELSKLIHSLRFPEVSRKTRSVLHRKLRASLRGYQEKGVAWLNSIRLLGLGGCLADDMGLGKTIQVIALLLLAKDENRFTKSLIVLPTGLLSNWQSELQRFAPSLRQVTLHGSIGSKNTLDPTDLDDCDIVITTYGSVAKYQKELDRSWDLIFLDEAQAIKNSDAKQTKLIKGLKGKCRFTLTGTPVENRLEDLWSLFDFSNPGLLGRRAEFLRYVKDRHKQGIIDYSPIKRLIEPYILRRLKTDKSIIDDLPQKIEMKGYCYLSKDQAALYQRSINEFAELLNSKDLDSMKRRGLVLSYILRFKQICNHPSQFLADGQYELKKSGKLIQLLERANEIKERQEKLLVFTQFREITDILDRYLKEVFGRAGHVLNGETPVKKRKKMVEKFQREEGAPYFILSLKAGGTGLNLTQANHVVHFDRWWNPAVEDQATDRAFRIGQKRNVVVHKFICKGTIEEKIDAIINEKKYLADSTVGSSEFNFTELDNQALIDLVQLDLRSALMGEG